MPGRRTVFPPYSDRYSPSMENSFACYCPHENSTNILEELLAGQVDWHPCKEKLVAINGKMTNKCNIVNTYQKHYMVLCFPSWLIWEKTDHRNRIHVSDARNLIGGVDASAKCDEETLEKLMDIPDLIFGILLIIIFF